MRKYKTVLEEVTRLESLICDKCGIEYRHSYEDIEFSSFTSFSRIGGYYAIEGDGVKVSYDLCEKCHSDLVRDFATFTFDYFKSDLPDVEYRYKKEVGYYTTNLIKDIASSNLNELLDKVHELEQEVDNDSDIFQNPQP